MKERPILFSGPMVRAILEGRKCMTRRVVKPQPHPEYGEIEVGLFHPTKIDRHGFEYPGDEIYGAHTVDGDTGRECPYGRPGDLLWVRETHYAYGRWRRDGFTKKGHEKWRFVRVEEMPIRFDEPKDGFRVSRDKSAPGKEQWYRRLARFMPIKYARIALELTGVRVERLQEITWEDAVAEGIQCVPTEDTEGSYWCVEPNDERGTADRPDDVYSFLWDAINGKGAWDANPWVWVVEFKRVEGIERIDGIGTGGKDVV